MGKVLVSLPKNQIKQKFCKTEISNLEMAITLANCKLGSNAWCHFVRFGVLYMASYSEFWNFLE
jgi:hypothetical protein